MDVFELSMRLVFRRILTVFKSIERNLCLQKLVMIVDANLVVNTNHWMADICVLSAEGLGLKALNLFCMSLHIKLNKKDYYLIKVNLKRNPNQVSRMISV